MKSVLDVLYRPVVLTGIRLECRLPTVCYQQCAEVLMMYAYVYVLWSQ